jgi:pimeloyl-ACP methyl ester carboxylesterase
MQESKLEAHRKALTEHGSVSYIDAGRGPAVLFVHGVFMNAYLWRKTIVALSRNRRCIAVDLPAHGQSTATPSQDLSLTATADLLAALCRHLELDAVDLVGNDTGGALCQIFAVRHRPLLRTLTLTNCDAHDNLPPAAFDLGKQLAAEGQLAPLIAELGKDPELARGEPGLAMGYNCPEALTDAQVLTFLGPFADLERGRTLERFINSTSVEDLLAVEPGLEALDAPTLIVWGNADLFFEVEWAHWLHDHIPGARPVIEIDGGGLFHPDEYADEFIPHLERFLAEHAPSATTAAA